MIMHSHLDHLIVLGCTSLLTGALSAFVFFKGRSKAQRIFGYYSLSLTWWSFFQMLMVWGPNPNIGIAWSRLEQAGVVFIPTLFIHFVAVFSNRLLPTWILRAAYFISSILACLSITTSLIASHVALKFGRIYFGSGGPLYPILLAYFGVCIVYGLTILLMVYQHSSPMERNRIRYLVWGSVLGYTGGAINFFMVYDIEAYPWNPYCTLLVPVYVGMVAYAILRHRLLDLSPIIRKTITYSVVTGVLTIIYFAIVSLFTQVFAGLSGYQTLFSSAIAACLVTICFHPLRMRVQVFIDAKFFRQYVDREEKLYELSREVITHTTPEAMAQALMRVLGDTLHPKVGALYLRVRDGSGFMPAANWGEMSLERMSEDNSLARYFADHPQPFVQDLPTDLGKSRSTREKLDRGEAA